MENTIDIDTKVLEQEIQYLKTLLATKVTTKHTVTSKGQAAESVKILLEYTETLDQTLNQLIQNTSTFLENAKDAMIDVDEASGQILSQLLEGEAS